MKNTRKNSFRPYGAIGLSILSLGILPPRNVHADTGVLQSFQTCATEVVDSGAQRELVRTLGKSCPSTNTPLNRHQESIIRRTVQVIQSSDWPRTVKKIAVVYDRFLDERTAALKRSDQELKRLEAKDSDTIAAELTEKFTRFNQLCAKFGDVLRKSSENASEVREKNQMLAAEALRTMIENDRVVKLFMSTETMLSHTRLLHDGNLGFRHCAEGKQIFTSVSGVGKKLIYGSSVRLMQKELRERWEKESDKITGGQAIVAQHKSIVDAAGKKNVAGNPATGAIRWMNSVNAAMGSEMADYPEAIATMLSDPRTKDPAVASILCTALSEANVRKTQMMVVGTVGAIGVGLLTGGAGTAIGMTATGIALAETGLGAVYGLIALQIQQSNSRARLAGSNMLGLLTDESMENVLSDELVEGYKSIAIDLAFFGVGKGLGKVLSKVGSAAEVRFVRYLAKQKGLGENEIEQLLVALKSASSGEKAQLAKEIFKAAKSGDGVRLEKALTKFKSGGLSVEPPKTVVQASTDVPPSPTKVNGKRTGIDGPKPEEPGFREMKEDLVVSVDPSAGPDIKKAAAELTELRKKAYREFSELFGNDVPPSVQRLANIAHNVPTWLDEAKTILNPKKAQAIAALREEMQAKLVEKHRAALTTEAKRIAQLKGVDWEKLSEKEKEKRIADAASSRTESVLLEMKGQGVLGTDARIPRSLQPLTYENENEIERILKEDGFSEETFNARGIDMGVTEAGGCKVYKTKSGETFIIKSSRLSTKKEAAAYVVSNQIKFGKVAQTELIEIDGKVYSAQKFIDTKKVRVIGKDGKETLMNLSEVVSNKTPDDMVLFDFLIGNIDRHRTGGHNFLVQTNETLPEVIDLRKGPFYLKDPKFIAIDHGLAFYDNDIGKFVNQYGTTGGPEDKVLKDQLMNMAAKNPEFINHLKAWSPESIQRDLGGYLKPEQIEAVIARRRNLINYYDILNH